MAELYTTSTGLLNYISTSGTTATYEIYGGKAFLQAIEDTIKEFDVKIEEPKELSNTQKWKLANGKGNTF